MHPLYKHSYAYSKAARKPMRAGPRRVERTRLTNESINPVASTSSSRARDISTSGMSLSLTETDVDITMSSAVIGATASCTVEYHVQQVTRIAAGRHQTCYYPGSLLCWSSKTSPCPSSSIAYYICGLPPSFYIFSSSKRRPPVESSLLT